MFLVYWDKTGYSAKLKLGFDNELFWMHFKHLLSMCAAASCFRHLAKNCVRFLETKSMRTVMSDITYKY